MPEANILEFPAEGRTILHEGDPGWDALSLVPSHECIDECVAWERRNAENVLALRRRHFLSD